MVRSSCYLLSFVLLGLAACGERAEFGVVVDGPCGATETTPFPLAIVRGRTSLAGHLTLRVRTEARTYAFEVAEGTTLAFEPSGDAAARPVRLPGSERSPADDVDAVRKALESAGLPLKLREGARDPGRFVLDVESGREDVLAEVVGLATGGADLRFLIEVLPSDQYRDAGDGEVPPRLRTEGAAPWDGTAEDFHAFKDAEVERYVGARRAGESYAPSRDDVFVLPRHGRTPQGPADFAVLEWPAEGHHRFDGRILANATSGRNPRDGRPVVLYEVRPEYQADFAEWTERNVGLPMAIVLDWEFRSAPTVQGPLRDSVQISLGEGSYSELVQEVNRLTRDLAAGAPATALRLVAAATWSADGSFVVRVPLAQGEETDVEVVAAVRRGGRGAQAARRFTWRPDVDVDAACAVATAVGEVLLGRLDVGEGAARLRGWLPDSVALLADRLAGDPSAAQRRVAAELLGGVDRASQDAAEALYAGLDDERGAVREAAAKSIGLLEPRPESVKELREALGVLEPDDQRPIVRALADLGGGTEGVVDALLDLAAAGEDRVRGVAQVELSGLGREAAPVLRAAAEEQHAERRAAAVRALGPGPDGERTDWVFEKTKDEAAVVRSAALLSLLESPRERTAEQLERLVELLGDEDARVRGNAVFVLSNTGAEGALPAVLHLLETGSADARSSALYVLANAQSVPEAARPLVDAALDDADPRVSGAAAVLHVTTGGDRSRVRPIAVRGLESEDHDTRLVALGLIGVYGVEVAEPGKRLSPLLEDDAEDVRVLAAAAMRKLGVATECSEAILRAVEEDAEHPFRMVLESGR